MNYQYVSDMKFSASIHHIAIVAAAAAACAAPAAAEDLRTEIEVDRTVVPVQRPASRLRSMSPVLVTPDVKRQTLSMSEYSAASDFAPTFNLLEPASYPALRPLSTYRGYASVGYFPGFNLGASAGYRFINKEKTRLGAWLQYNGSSYNSHIAAGGDDRPTVSNNTVTVGADFAQRFGKKSNLMIGVDYTHAALGLPTDADPSQKQGINLADVKASWWSTVGKVGYHANFDFSHTGLTKDIAFQAPLSQNPRSLAAAGENRFTVALGAIGRLKSAASSWIGIELKADILHVMDGLFLSEARTYGPWGAGDMMMPVTGVHMALTDYSGRTSGIYSVKPYFGFGGSNVHARIGLDVDVSTGVDTKFHVAPDVMIDWNPASQVAVYGRFTGGEEYNTLRSLYDVSPFAPGINTYVNSYSPVKGRVGVVAGPFAGATAEVFAGYEATRNVPMPVVLSDVSFYNPDVMYTAIRDFNGFFSNNLSGWHAGVNLSYRWRSKFEAKAGFRILPSSYSHGLAECRDRARYIATASVEFRPIEKLSLGLDYELRAGRKYYRFDRLTDEIGYVRKAVAMSNVSRLDFNATYAITDAFSAFVRVENMLCRRPEVLPFYTAQGLHGLFGVSLKF